MNIFEQTAKDMADNKFNMMENGKCTECGRCCSSLLPMTIEEINRIDKYIKARYIKEQSLMDRLSCPFLDSTKKEHKCLVYEVRPRVCRDFVCDTTKRPPVNPRYAVRTMPIDARECFYGKGN